MKRPRFIDHRGKQILYLNLAHASPGEQAASLESAAEAMAPAADGSVLLLVDVTGSIENARIDEDLGRFGAAAGTKLRARAVVGATGLRRLTFERNRAAFSGEAALFDDVEPARDWLAER
ncbi:MAG TPA: hypothetical protein VLU43_09415 [Anaeromyxobacteraceae bacterium]|nr:hypothetical protein [Anaeromyxobacteraceae bacterium]